MQVGYVSHGMVLCASSENHAVVEVGGACVDAPVVSFCRPTTPTDCRALCPVSFQLLDAPVGAKAGHRLGVAAFPGEPDAEVNPSKKGNAWSACIPLLKTDDMRRATFGGHVLVAPNGEACLAASVAQGSIS